MSASNRSQKHNIELMTTDYSVRSAMGLVEGVTTWNKFGYNLDIDTGSFEVIAEFGGVFNQKLDSAETLSIVSSSSEDATGGTGVVLAIVFGVDGDWNEVTEVVTLTGLTPVLTTNSFLGVNRLTIYQSGTADGNVGAITATASSSGNVMATMPAAQGTTQQCIFYVPAGKTFLAEWVYMSGTKTSGGGTAEFGIRGYVYSAVVDSKFEVFRDTISLSGEPRFQLTPGEPFVVSEKSILWFESNTTASNAAISCRFSGKLVTN